MKLIVTTAAAALISTAALADNSTRYNDLRLDTSDTAERVYSDAVRPTDGDRAQRGQDQRLLNNDTDSGVNFSTRNALQSPGEGYIYGGFGPGNDSR